MLLAVAPPRQAPGSGADSCLSSAAALRCVFDSLLGAGERRFGASYKDAPWSGRGFETSNGCHHTGWGEASKPSK
eukprot:366394-Chlamydomonas_euryale.AAC.4